MVIPKFKTHACDFRTNLKNNTRKTYMVFLMFIILYVLIGFIADLAILHATFPYLPLSSLSTALILFQQIPYATCLLLGLALLSILITYRFYDKIMLLGTNYREIRINTALSFLEKQLVNVVDEMRIAAGLSYIPKIYLIDAPYMNAFASGFNERSAMVAITSGLLNKLDRSELQAVMAHELSHIRHQDVKLTITVSILSNLLLIVVDILFYTVLFKREERENNNRLLTVLVLLRYLLPLMTVLLTLFLSRTREYMADAGAVELMRANEPLARALLKIAQDHESNAPTYAKAYGDTPHEQVRTASYLFDPSAFNPATSLMNLFSTHPAISDRLKAIGFIKK